MAVVRRAGHEGVHASVEVGVVAKVLHIIGSDGALGKLLEEVHEVLLRRLAIADELGRHSREERQIGGAVERSDLLIVLLLQGVIPRLEVGLRHRVEILLLALLSLGARHARQRRRMMVHNLPHAVDLAPHVGEARLHRCAVVGRTGHEGVHASVEVGVVAEVLHVIFRNCALGQLLEEVHEVLLRRLRVADELGRHSREERQILRAVKRSDLLIVLLLKSVIPCLEVCLQPHPHLVSASHRFATFAVNHLCDRIEILLNGYFYIFARNLRRMVMDDLPFSCHQSPHVGEACLYRSTVVLRPGHESIHPSVQIGIRAKALHCICGDFPLRQALHKVHEVALS